MFDDEVKEILKTYQAAGAARDSGRVLKCLKVLESIGALGLDADFEERIDWVHVHGLMVSTFPLGQKVPQWEFEEFARILCGNRHPELIASFFNIEQVMTLPKKHLRNVYLVIRLVMRDDVSYIKAEEIFNSLQINLKEIERKVVKQHLLTHPQVPLKEILQHVNVSNLMVPNFMQARTITVEEFQQFPLKAVEQIIKAGEKSRPFPVNQTWGVLWEKNLKTLKEMVEEFRRGDGAHFWEAFKGSNLTFEEVEEMKDS